MAADTKLIAACGLYCGQCRAFSKGRCPGCGENDKAGWCKIRSCCSERLIASCADCQQYADVNKCGKFNNFISKLFGFVFNSDRSACIDQIRQQGYQQHAKIMDENGRQSIKRR